MLIVLALPSTEGAAVITGTGWRRGGGACGARPTGGLAARAAGRPHGVGAAAERPSVDDAPEKTARPALRRGRGCEPLDAPMRPIGHGTKAVERGRSGREDAARGRRATGILKLKELVPGVPLPCSLTVRRLRPGTPGGFGAPPLPEGEVETAPAVRVRGRAISGGARSRALCPAVGAL